MGYRCGGSRAWAGGDRPSWSAWWPHTPASGARRDARCPTTWRSYWTEDPMRLFDPHIHMTSRTTDDYQAMAAAGIRAIVEPAFWLGQPRTSVGSFVDY